MWLEQRVLAVEAGDVVTEVGVGTGCRAVLLGLGATGGLGLPLQDGSH